MSCIWVCIQCKASGEVFPQDISTLLTCFPRWSPPYHDGCFVCSICSLDWYLATFFFLRLFLKRILVFNSYIIYSCITCFRIAALINKKEIIMTWFLLSFRDAEKDALSEHMTKKHESGDRTMIDKTRKWRNSCKKTLAIYKKRDEWTSEFLQWGLMYGIIITQRRDNLRYMHDCEGGGLHGSEWYPMVYSFVKMWNLNRQFWLLIAGWAQHWYANIKANIRLRSINHRIFISTIENQG